MNIEESDKLPPWITKGGSLDPAKFPIECLLRQAMERGGTSFQAGLAMLQMMHHSGREEAGVFLLGLLAASDDNWDKRLAIVEALREVQTEACVRLLVAELRRVKSSNTTRRYLNGVIKTLAAMPAELVQEKFEALAQDTCFSYRLRSKFRAASEPDFPAAWL